jgi:hypothetical protein
MSSVAPSPPEQGQLVSVRSRQWVVSEVAKSTLPEEPGAKVIEKVALPEPTGFDPPDKLDAFLDAVRWGAASTAAHLLAAPPAPDEATEAAEGRVRRQAGGAAYQDVATIPGPSGRTPCGNCPGPSLTGPTSVSACWA